MQTHFAEGKGKNQSCNMKNDVFVIILLFIFNFHVIEGEKMRSRIIAFEVFLRFLQLMTMNQLQVFFSDIVN